MAKYLKVQAATQAKLTLQKAGNSIVSSHVSDNLASRELGYSDFGG